jgi:hypothetical protein
MHVQEIYCFDLVIEYAHIVVMGWGGVGDVEVEQRHNMRVNNIVDGIEMHVGGI